MFFKDGVEQMMRNGSCFVIIFLVTNYSHSLNRQISQTPFSNNGASKHPTLHMNAHKTVNSMAPKVIPSGVKQDLFTQSPHPFQAITFTISHFMATKESFNS